MNPFGQERPDIVQQVSQLVSELYHCNDNALTIRLTDRLTEYMNSDGASKLLQHVITSGDELLIIYACNSLLTFLKKHTLNTQQLLALLAHVNALSHLPSLALPPSVVNKYAFSPIMP